MPSWLNALVLISTRLNGEGRTMRVMTAAGRIGGSAAAGLFRFRGVPYAAPPFGPLRLRAPQPPPPWDGVRDCTRQGDGAPQPYVRDDPWDAYFNPAQQGADCLTLQITTPEPGATRLPVLVWIHGGAFATGVGSAPIYPGDRFAHAGIVHVAVNYRLGVDGYCHLDQDIVDGADNRGLRDQVAALRWVRDNIAGFGGDPDRVTVAGQSAGAISVAYLLASPAGRGLFRHAISQSGMGGVTASPDAARLVTARTAAVLGVAPTRAGLAGADLDRIRAVVAHMLVEARTPAHRAAGLVPALPYLGVHATPMLPEPVAGALAAGAAADVPVLAGTTRDEVSGNLRKAGALDDPDAGRATARLAALGVGDRVVEAYRTRGAGPAALVAAVLSDQAFRMPTIALLEAHRGRHHLYRFDWESPAFPPGLGADHTLDIPFVHDALGPFAALGPTGRAQLGADPPQRLADAMHRAWVGFVTTGDPGWKSYTGEHRATMRFDADSEVVDDLGGAERAAWSR